MISRILAVADAYDAMTSIVLTVPRCLARRHGVGFAKVRTHNLTRISLPHSTPCWIGRTPLSCRPRVGAE